jgi:rhodanese-related sulfurtransferase
MQLQRLKDLQMQDITPQEAFAQIASGSAIGIDVREPLEWEAGHAENVIWNPMSTFDVNALPTDKPLIFICRSGNRSGQVATAVADQMENVFNMIGGMKAWNEAGLAMVSANGNPEVA